MVDRIQVRQPRIAIHVATSWTMFNTLCISGRYFDNSFGWASRRTSTYTWGQWKKKQHICVDCSTKRELDFFGNWSLGENPGIGWIRLHWILNTVYLWTLNVNMYLNTRTVWAAHIYRYNSNKYLCIQPTTLRKYWSLYVAAQTMFKRIGSIYFWGLRTNNNMQ